MMKSRHYCFIVHWYSGAKVAFDGLLQEPAARPELSLHLIPMAHFGFVNAGKFFKLIR